jgi:hypothetical protein
MEWQTCLSDENARDVDEDGVEFVEDATICPELEWNASIELNIPRYPFEGYGDLKLQKTRSNQFYPRKHHERQDQLL